MVSATGDLQIADVRSTAPRESPRYREKDGKQSTPGENGKRKWGAVPRGHLLQADEAEPDGVRQELRPLRPFVVRRHRKLRSLGALRSLFACLRQAILILFPHEEEVAYQEVQTGSAGDIKEI